MVYQHKIGKISKLRQRSVILLAVLTLVAQPLYGIFANQGANAVSQAPFSVDVTCQDSKAVFNLVTRQAELPGVPQDARNWYATVTYQAGEYGNRVQTLSEKDIDTWTIPTGKYSTDTVGMSARIVGGYTMREDIIVFGQKVGSWDKPHIYTRTLHAESATKICDTTKPSVSVLLSKDVISPADNNNPSVTIDATDSESGIDSIEYKISPRNDTNNNIIGWTSVSNGVATEVTGANALDDGHYTLRARAFDNVGNKNSGNDVDFMVDGTDATTQILAPVKDEPISGTYRFHGTAADDVSGVEKVLIRIGTLEGNKDVFTDWTDFDSNTGEWYLDVNTIENKIPDGIYNVRARAVDNAGNNGNSGMHVLRNFVVDNTTPQDQDGDEQPDQPDGFIIDPSPDNLSGSTGGSEISSTSAPAFTAFGLTFNDSGFVAGSPIPEGGEDILGAEDDGFGSTFGDGNVLGQTAAAQDMNNSPLKAFGVLWYWWLVAFAVFATVWWLIAAKRRKQTDEVRI